MTYPESIPEDESRSYRCQCGGNITQNIVTGKWECDRCAFSEPEEEEI